MNFLFPVVLIYFLYCGIPEPHIMAQTHKVVRISSKDVRNPAEVSVSINPKDTKNIVAVGLGHGGSKFPKARNFAFVTKDGGKTWKTIAAHNPEPRNQGDDSVVFDANGFVHHCYIAFRRPSRRQTQCSGIHISTSQDGGLTWKKPVVVVDHLNTMAPMEDKPYIVVNRAKGSPYFNHLYMAWTRFDVYGSKNPQDHSQIYFSGSANGGKSFSSPIRISDKPGDCIDGDGTLEGAIVACGVDGEIYVVWSGPRGIEFDKSLDGGKTFGEDRQVGKQEGGWDINIKGISRANGMPVTVVDQSYGPNRGTIYVNWVDERNGDPDVFVAYSRDKGETWSKPIRVNDDPQKNKKDQFFTWMAVDPSDGSINIVFFDRRNTDGTHTELMLARSIDGGNSFRNFKIDLPAFEMKRGAFFGDYIGIDAKEGVVVPAFMHFIAPRKLAISAAIFHFQKGTQNTND